MLTDSQWCVMMLLAAMLLLLSSVGHAHPWIPLDPESWFNMGAAPEWVRLWCWNRTDCWS